MPENQVNDDMDNDVDALWELINSLKAEVAHQKARKNSIGHETDKWRRRAIASRAEVERGDRDYKSLQLEISELLCEEEVAERGRKLLTKRISSLETVIQDYKDDYTSAMEDRPHDEIHCTCVPVLKKRIKELEAIINA